MNLYMVVVFIHVAAAIALVSSSVIMAPRVRAAIRDATTIEDVRSYVNISRPLHLLEPLSALLVLLTGIYLTSVASFWTQGWVQIAVVCWIANSIIASVFVNPVLGRLATTPALPFDATIPPELEAVRRSPRWIASGDALMANDMAMVWLMTIKPDLVGSLLAVAFSNAAAISWRAMRRPSRPSTFSRRAQSRAESTSSSR
jgi:uncharacterized membrane protein